MVYSISFLFVALLYIYFLGMLVSLCIYFYFLFSVSFLRGFLLLYIDILFNSELCFCRKLLCQ